MGGSQLKISSKSSVSWFLSGIVDMVQKAKYLDLQIDSFLCWKEQIKVVPRYLGLLAF